MAPRRHAGALLAAAAATAVVLTLVANVSSQRSAGGAAAAATHPIAVHSRKLMEDVVTLPDYTNQPRPDMTARNCLQSTIDGVAGAVNQVSEVVGDSISNWLGLEESDQCVYGNWCGGGCSGLNGEPIDDLDEACKVHDNCYTSTDNCDRCKCDAELIAEMDKIVKADSRGCGCLNIFCWEDNRVKAAELTKYAMGMLHSSRQCSSCSTAAYSSEAVSSVDSTTAEIAELLQASSDLASSVYDALNATLGAGVADFWTALTTGLLPGGASPSPGYSSSPSASPDYVSSPSSPSPSPDTYSSDASPDTYFTGDASPSPSPDVFG